MRQPNCLQASIAGGTVSKNNASQGLSPPPVNRIAFNCAPCPTRRSTFVVTGTINVQWLSRTQGLSVTGHHSKIAAFTVCGHPKIIADGPVCSIHNESREN
jgi:hypothetical protein